MTWLDLPPGTGFGLANLPFGIFTRVPGGDGGPAAGTRPEGADECESGVHRTTANSHSYALADGRVGAAIGDSVLDVAAVADDLRLPMREVVITATAPGSAGERISFGEVRGRVIPRSP
jgi:hypothetical protein